jgi:curved DNA-binding protein CbpA
MPAIRDYYKELGLSRHATQAQIEDAWKAWKRDPKNHPDTHPIASDKARVERLFQEHSEAYQVLSNKNDRDKYDAQLERIAAAARAHAADEASHSYTIPKQDPHKYGFHESDPASAEADWGGGQASAQSGWANSYATRRPLSQADSMLASVMRYFRLTPLLIITSALVAVWVLYIALSPHPAPTSGDNNPIISQPTPSSNPDPGIVAGTPTPTPTPNPTVSACPSGGPIISNVSGQSAPTQGSNQNSQDYTYTVTGQITNPTSDPVTIGDIGFYLSSSDQSNAPDWTDQLSSMTVSPSTDSPSNIAPGDTINFTETHQVTIPQSQNGPSNRVTASIDYPTINGASAQNTWNFETGSCQPPSSSN